MFITLAGRWSAAGRPASGLRLSRLRRRMVERVELFDSLGRGRLTRADRDIAGHPELTARGGAVAGGEERVAQTVVDVRRAGMVLHILPEHPRRHVRHLQTVDHVIPKAVQLQFRILWR